MFSEYASRFLQQSQARLSFTQQDGPQPYSNDHRTQSRSRNPLDRRRGPVPASTSRYVQRPGSMQPPYRNPSSSQSRFPFASRLSRPDPPAAAPLFYSAADDFGAEDGEEEHEKEVADFYALQRSRRQFGRSGLTESSELDEDDDGMVGLDAREREREESVQRGRTRASRLFPQQDRDVSPSVAATDFSSTPSSKGKRRLVDVNLASTINEEPSESLTNLAPMVEPQRERSPSYQNFRPSRNTAQSTFLPLETDEESRRAYPGPASPSIADSVPPTVILPTPSPPTHDRFWGTLFQITTFAMFAASILIWFHTSTPSSKKPLGDTIYATLRGSTYMLAWDTVAAVLVSLLWLALLRNHARSLVWLMLVAVPVVLFTFSLYPLISSFKGAAHGSTLQDRLLRWFSLIPALLGIFWTYSIVRSRHSLHRATAILEFATRILSACPQLLLLGFATLATVVVWTWTWLLMFERIFLSGHMARSGASRFILDANSWWLGAAFILQYLWTLSVIAGLQRATTAAVVSQWYFHRLSVPQPSSTAITKASLNHATGALFGTICLSTFLALLVRLPLILLPGRLAGVLNMAAYWLIPSSLATLTNPLTLTYAAIHSQPLGIAARQIAQLSFVSRTNPSNALNPRSFSHRTSPRNPDPGLLPYRLAKLLLTATRTLTSLALGLAGWVRTAHSLRLPAPNTALGLKGSLYAYIVALVAGTIGYAVLGAIEGVVAGVLDAAVVCWASETGGGRAGSEARFCREAGALFGGEGGAGAGPGEEAGFLRRASQSGKGRYGDDEESGSTYGR